MVCKEYETRLKGQIILPRPRLPLQSSLFSSSSLFPTPHLRRPSPYALPPRCPNRCRLAIAAAAPYGSGRGTPRRFARHTQVIPNALKERQSQSCKKGEKRGMEGKSHLDTRKETRQLSLKIIIPVLPASPCQWKKGVRRVEVLKARFLLPSISIPTRKASWITYVLTFELHTPWQRRHNAQF